MINEMDPTDRVGQDHGKGSHMNRISSGALSSQTRKILLVATSGLPPISSPTSAVNSLHILVKCRESGDQESLFAIFYSFSFFIFGPFDISKIKWTKFEEKRNFRGRWDLELVSGPDQEIPGYASAVPRSPPNPKHVAER